MRYLLLALLLLSSACTPLSGSCQLLSEIDGCPECADGPVTCSFGDHEVTEESCGGCQARASLLDILCTDGAEASRAELEAGIVCVDAP